MSDNNVHALLPVVKLLMNGIARHSVKGDLEAFRKFHGRIHQISLKINEDRSPGEALAFAGQAVDAAKEYGHHTSRHLRQEGTELHAIIKLLLHTFQELAIAGPERMSQLRELGAEVSSTSDGDKLTRCKLRFGECLNSIRLEAERFRTDAEGRAGSGVVNRDQLTGLEDRETAEAALATSCSSGVPGCAVIVLVPHIPVYGVRFGRTIGDDVLRFFIDSLIKRLPFKQAPFRWSGPSLLMLCSGTADQVMPAIRRVLAQRIEYEVETPSRNILLPITARWDVVPMMTDSRLMVNKIDAFVVSAAQSGPSRKHAE